MTPFRDTKNSFICLIRCDFTNGLQLSLYDTNMKLLTVLRSSGLTIGQAIRPLPKNTEYFFDKFLSKEIR